MQADKVVDFVAAHASDENVAWNARSKWHRFCTQWGSQTDEHDRHTEQQASLERIFAMTHTSSVSVQLSRSPGIVASLTWMLFSCFSLSKISSPNLGVMPASMNGCSSAPCFKGWYDSHSNKHDADAHHSNGIVIADTRPQFNQKAYCCKYIHA